MSDAQNRPVANAVAKTAVEKAVAEVRAWLDDVVIGLNLCPFASRPARLGQVHYSVSEAEDEEQLLQELQAELQALEATSAGERETTLLIVPTLLEDFYDYNQFLEWVDQLILRGGWEGQFQVASFHPHYQFAGTEPDDAENLTNRAPYPILHLLREQSLEAMLARYPDSDQIPERNIATMNELSEAQIQRLFGYLFRAN